VIINTNLKSRIVDASTPQVSEKTHSLINTQAQPTGA